jgi:hypothetical protein
MSQARSQSFGGTLFVHSAEMPWSRADDSTPSKVVISTEKAVNPFSETATSPFRVVNESPVSSQRRRNAKPLINFVAEAEVAGLIPYFYGSYPSSIRLSPPGKRGRLSRISAI